MARKTISQRIALTGGDEIKKQLSQFGDAGERAFSDVQKAAEKLRGPGAEFARSMDRAREQIKALGDQVEKVGRGIRNFGAGLSVAVTAPLVMIGKKATDAWRQQEEAVKRVDAALKSTGGTVGLTSDQIQTMASDFQKATTFGDEAILEMQARLLTFTNITGDKFGQASKAVLNLSAAMGQDLNAAVLQIGKALNDPVKGISALSRSGIQFSREQEAMIRKMVEVGDVAGAQSLMLAELEKQFGGMAEQLAQTDTGKWANAMNLLGDALEDVGKILAPYIADLAAWIAKMSTMFIELPRGVQNTIVATAAMVATLGPLLMMLGSATIGLSALLSGFVAIAGTAAAILPTLAGLSGAFGALSGALGIVGSVMLGVLTALVSWPVVLAAAGAAIGALIVAVAMNLDKVKEIWATIDAWADGIVASLQAKAQAAAGEVARIVFDAVQAVQEWAVGLGDQALSAVQEGFSAVLDWLSGAFADISGMASETWDSLGDGLQAALDAIGGAFEKVVGFIGSQFDRLDDWADGVVSNLRSKVQSLLSLVGLAKDAGSSTGSGSDGGGGILRGWATGGSVRGPGTATSDSILARLSNGEFVVRARAVQHYGPQLFEMLNRMRLPPGSLLPGLASGGLANGASVPISDAPVAGPAGPYASFALSIGGESFGGLTAPRETAERLIRFAMNEQAKSAGRRPGWYRG